MTTSSVSTHIDWDAAGNEVVSHLQDLLRLDMRNPPGNEIRAAQHLSAVLRREGIDSQIVGPTPERASLVARLRGNGSAPPLLLMSHTDVVAVEPEKWTHDPFAADIADNFIYGRGALDMKNMVAIDALQWGARVLYEVVKQFVAE
jgi:acetylornithine deacetylase/succinyl-diaminopimelate desuccinylase-like protein